MTKINQTREEWGHHKSRPSTLPFALWSIAKGADSGSEGLPLRIPKIPGSCNWHDTEWGMELLPEIIRSPHVQYVVNNKRNFELATETESVLTWGHRWFMFGKPCLAHEGSRHIQNDLMNLLGRSQTDHFTGAPCRKHQRQTKRSATQNWERRYSPERYWL